MLVHITTPEQEGGNLDCWVLEKIAAVFSQLLKKSSVMLYLGMDLAPGEYSEDRQSVMGD